MVSVVNGCSYYISRECTNTGVMVREGAEATIVVIARAGEKNTETAADNTGAKAHAEAGASAKSIDEMPDDSAGPRCDGRYILIAESVMVPLDARKLRMGVTA